MKLCKCGCGEEIKVRPQHKYTGVPDYIPGHYWRGKKFTKKHKENLSKSVTEKIKRGEFVNHWFLPGNEERREKIGSHSKEVWGNYTEEERDNRTHKISVSLNERPTKPERTFMEFCKRNNLMFKYNGDNKICVNGFYPDFISCSNEKVALDIFGRYWHEKRKNLPERATEDYRRKKFEEYGWKLIVIWEDELKELSDGELLNKLSLFGSFGLWL